MPTNVPTTDPRGPTPLRMGLLLAAAAGMASASPSGRALPPAPTCPDMRLFTTGAPALDAALLTSCGREADPAAFVRGALAGLNRSPMCFPDTMTREEWDVVLQHWGLRPPAMLGNLDFWVDLTDAWVGAGAQGPSGRALRASLTYSFPDDGVIWGLPAASATGPNNLGASLVSLFGAGRLDLGREYLRQCLAGWRKHCGLTYSEVADLNIAANEVLTFPGNGGGDIRIGGRGFGTGTFLAYNAFPSAAFAGVGGGDMCINTSFLAPGFSLTNPANDFRYFRNTAAHEHGHGGGNIHSVPCDHTKLMEPAISGARDMHGADDKRGGARNYGDRFSGNQSPANAADFGDLASPAARSVIELDLSTNGVDGFANSGEDWFRFTLSSPQAILVTADPTGGTYTAGQQTGGCNGAQAAINADTAGNLNVELRDAAGAVVLHSAASAAPGVTESLDAGTLAAGEYTLRVFDVGPNAAANQGVQLYDLTIRVGAAFAPPQAIAGISKRIAADTDCFFMGDINSRATEPGATITGYEWDTDGDGLFETHGAKVNRQYVSNGVYPVTLRVTDSNGSVGTDTINVTVFGAVPEPCPGDTNGDLIVNFADLNIVLSQFGQSGAGLSGDVNGDGQVNFGDLNIVLSNFGLVC